MIIQINMNKARDIHRNNIRQARKPKLEELDIKFQRELEKGASANTGPIVEQKQILRDAPADPSIENAQTPEDLVNLWNEDLLGPTPYH